MSRLRASTAVLVVAATLPALASAQTYRIYSASLESFGSSTAMGEVVVFISRKRLVAAGTATGLQASIVAHDFAKPRLGTAATGPGAYMMTGASCGTAASFGYPAQIEQPGTYVDVWQASHSYTTDAQGDSQFSVVVRWLRRARRCSIARAQVLHVPSPPLRAACRPHLFLPLTPPPLSRPPAPLSFHRLTLPRTSTS